MGEKNMTARQTAFEILKKTEKDEAYSDLALDSYLTRSSLSPKDRGFVAALVYGCTERKLTLDYEISLYLKTGISKLKKNVLIILRMGAYQLLFMDKIPSFSAVNESVDLAKSSGCSYAAGLINAVLRRISENGAVYPPEKDRVKHLSIKYSCPEELICLWDSDYGEEHTEAILKDSLGVTDMTLRVNTLRTDTKELFELLSSEGLSVREGILENTLVIDRSGCDPEKLPEFKKGLFHFQDTASQLCVKALDPKKNERILDLCSAPGGKAFTCAEIMGNTGSITAFDKYPGRTELIDEGAQRLGINNITTCVVDAERYYGTVLPADRVLCDVPCSGLGVIRKKPEIKYKSLDSFSLLPEIQYRILSNGAKYVRPGGRLVYSTCTLNRAENDCVCDRFLLENPDFSYIRPLDIETIGDKYYTLMPHVNGTDGFFIAVFERTEA